MGIRSKDLPSTSAFSTTCNAACSDFSLRASDLHDKHANNPKRQKQTDIFISHSQKIRAKERKGNDIYKRTQIKLIKKAHRYPPAWVRRTLKKNCRNTVIVARVFASCFLRSRLGFIPNLFHAAFLCNLMSCNTVVHYTKYSNSIYEVQ